MKRFFKNQQSYAFLAVFGTFSLLSCFSCLDTFGVNDVNGTLVGDEKTTLATSDATKVEEEATPVLEELQQGSLVESETEVGTDMQGVSPETQEPEKKVDQAKADGEKSTLEKNEPLQTESKGKEKSKEVSGEQMGPEQSEQQKGEQVGPEKNKDASDDGGFGNPPEQVECVTYYLDSDSDGFGNSEKSKEFCLPEGQDVSGEAQYGPDGEYYADTSSEGNEDALYAYVSDDTDCDDEDAEINPDAIEIYGNDVDDNCDGLSDEDPETLLLEILFGSNKR